MAIQVRRGPYTRFTPLKLLPGEPATVLNGDPNSVDGTSVYMCFNAGDVKRLATYEDMKGYVDQATEEVQDAFTAGIEAATQAAETATAEATAAKNAANTAATGAQEAADRANELYEAIRDTDIGDLAVIKQQIAEIIAVLSNAIGTAEEE